MTDEKIYLVFGTYIMLSIHLYNAQIILFIIIIMT